MPSQNIIANLNVRKIEQHHYAFIVSSGVDNLFDDAGFGSISEALLAACATEGAIAGYAVAYEGIVAGTYLLNELLVCHEEVAKHMLLTTNKFCL